MPTNNLREGAAYISVAGLSAVSDWLVFTAISMMFPAVDVVFAQAPARLTGGLVAFMMHRSWSFRNQQGQGLGTEAGRFLALYVFSFVVSLGTVFVLVDLLGANRYGSKAVADILCFVVNFFVMKFYVFGDAKSLNDAASKLRNPG
jgi:putative flippase GtrA